MGILSGLQPQSVFEYFEEICGIPHGSGNVEAISNYLAGFAAERGLNYIQDEAKNVIIFKKGTPGYESSAPVIIQGHMDMVCEKVADCPLDMEKDGIQLVVEGGFVKAKGTTLGGDNGIAVAYALALLDADDIPHPPLQVLMTTDEEVGMLGAGALDTTPLTGKVFLNLDSGPEGILTAGCAGGVRANITLPVDRKTKTGVLCRLTLGGAQGGHSGVDIHKGLINTNQMMGRVLYHLAGTGKFRLIGVEGGSKDNVICNETTAELLVKADRLHAFSDAVTEMERILRKEYETPEPDLYLTFEAGDETEEEVLTGKSFRRLMTLVSVLPGGVSRMSPEVAGAVQTSCNMGVLKTEEDCVKAMVLLRSTVASEKEALYEKVEALTNALGGTVEGTSQYPAWEYRKESPLREMMSRLYEKQFGYAPKIEVTHGGLECGLFYGKMPDVDFVAFGPDLFDVHSPRERMNIASVERYWTYLLSVLAELR